MRPPSLISALIAVTVGAILTYTVSFTIFGISIHTVGVIIALAGLVSLVIRLARSLRSLRKRDEFHRAPPPQRPDAEARYPQNSRHAAPPSTVMQMPGNAPAESAQRRVDEPHSAVPSRARRAPQR